MIKKISFLAGASFIAISSSFAVDVAPQVSLGGYSRFQAYASHNNNVTDNDTTLAAGAAATNPSAGKQAYAFSQSGEISFTVEGKTDDGLMYDYLITLEGDHGQNTSDFKPAANENRIQLQDAWGTVQLGNTDGVQDYLVVGPLNVLSGTGGFAGDMHKVFTSPAEVYSGTLMKGDSGTATKFSYYTPRLAGLQMGVSFTPSSAQKGSVVDSSTASGVYSTGNVSVAANYAYAWNDVGLILSLATIQGKSKIKPSTTTSALGVRAEDVKAWQAGVLLTIDKWMFGANYTDNGKSMVPETYAKQGADAGKAYAAAIGYNFGPSVVAFGYQHSWTNVQAKLSKAKADIYSVTADYNIAPGLGVYAEVDYASMKTNTTAVDRVAVTNGKANKTSNAGGTLITGIKIAF